MEDWLQEFDPLVQGALSKAFRLIEQRGGDALSIEDLLLVLLESHYPLAAFLQGRGVDIDELVRAIQCEQPIVSVPSEQDGFSQDMIAWFARARENSRGIRGLAQLMRTLVHECEWLSQRAYIAVLEQVGERQWGGIDDHGAARISGVESVARSLAPLESGAWPASDEGFAQARRIAALSASETSPLLQMPTRSIVQAKGIMTCAASVYADCFGQSVAAWHVPVAALSRNGRRISQALSEVARGSEAANHWFFLDGVHPELLAAVVEREGIRPWAELAADPSTVLVLAHPPDEADSGTTTRLCAQLGLSWSVLWQPRVSGADVLRYCQDNQPRLEASIGMTVEIAALRLAVAASTGQEPAMAVENGLWLDAAADYDRAESILRAAGALVQSEWALGPVRLATLRSRERMDEQAELLTLAREDATAANLVDEAAALEKVATEVDWLEQVRAGTPALDKAAVLRWLESSDSASSSPDGFWYDARCVSVATRE
ncbi:hypothetical protein DES49_1019 [Halospina denitrificans]|uniref:ClpA/ClpB-like protein n=1 Tax=Halospina denitrificans TaxID=332522 RepID=A0A4R7JYD8_9GAMM|nr:hypothetical protein [Halospina denitrificans]TDT43205.1 hypothetical protein DES49_1019 [Halospina denitrificans]